MHHHAVDATCSMFIGSMYCSGFLSCTTIVYYSLYNVLLTMEYDMILGDFSCYRDTLVPGKHYFVSVLCIV